MKLSEAANNAIAATAYKDPSDLVTNLGGSVSTAEKGWLFATFPKEDSAYDFEDAMNDRGISCSVKFNGKVYVVKFRNINLI